MKQYIKAALLVLLIIGALFVFDAFGGSKYVDRDTLRETIGAYGPLAPLAFIVVSATASTLLVPASIFTVVAAILFGGIFGFIYVIIGAMIAAIVSFWLSRHLGRDFARHVAGKRLQKYDDLVQQHGFATILYLRLLYLPFPVVNYGAGLTKVSFRDYLFGTFIGVIPPTFIFVFFFSQVAVTQVSDLWRWQFFVSVAMFIGSFFIPTLVKKYYHLRER